MMPVKSIEDCSGLDVNRHASPGHLEEMFGVPVREAEAAMRFGAADLLRLRRAVNAVARTTQANPRCADGVIRTGGDVELAANFFCFGGFAENFRAEKIGGI